MVDRPRPFGFTLPLPRARQNPGNFPVQFRGGKITDAEINATSLRLESIRDDGDTGTATFTNTSFLDLDAVTGGTALSGPVAVSVSTNERALIMWRCELNSTAGIVYCGYRVSGATTVTASDTRALGNNNASAYIAAGTFELRDGLTPGVNTVELQARVTSGTGSLRRVELVVIPI